ncbi:MAG TPA: WbqC family protein, partial [Acidimicrobiales bacterium]|nr:WbqC family protein [Acidimicrobiales bacterium]
HRNRIRTGNGLDWLTVPVRVKGKFGQRIVDVEISESTKFPVSHIGQISLNYGKAAFFEESAEILETIASFSAGSLLHQLTESIIRQLAGLLDIPTPMIRSSELACAGQRSSLLVAICNELQADHYLSPVGSVEYLRTDIDLFKAAGISIVIQNFEHPNYPQMFSPFISHASVIDALLNTGAKTTRSLIKSGSHPPLLLEAQRDA